MFKKVQIKKKQKSIKIHFYFINAHLVTSESQHFSHARHRFLGASDDLWVKYYFEQLR